SSGGKKIHISGLVRLNSVGNELGPPVLPPLIDPSPYSGRSKPAASETVHVSCFSNPNDIQKTQQEMVDHYLYNPLFASNPSDFFPRIPLPYSFYPVQPAPVQGNLQYPGTFSVQDQAILRGLIENCGPTTKQSLKTEKEMATSVSQETGLSNEMNAEISSVVSNLEPRRRPFEYPAAPSTSVGPVDLDYFWNY
ncbi:hypothetical protein U1Q18_005310, partial [Sarracenia purpurea var. burkii]